MTCQARREQDQYACAKCRLRWDVSDPEPPLCGLKVATRDMQERLENSVGYVSALAPVVDKLRYCSKVVDGAIMKILGDIKVTVRAGRAAVATKAPRVAVATAVAVIEIEIAG